MRANTYIVIIPVILAALSLNALASPVSNIVASGVPNGYTYSVGTYNGAIYVYYTVQLPSGITWINGYKIIELNMTNAPLPQFHAVAVASPILFALPNGSLAMLWAAIPSIPGSLSNLLIILQLAVLNNNAWTNPINITSTGVAYSYYAGGNYIYVLWAPNITDALEGDGTLMIYTVSGELIYEQNLVGAHSIIGGVGEDALVTLMNGSEALVTPQSIQAFPLGTQAGVVLGMNAIFTYSNGLLTIYNGTGKIEISIQGITAWPAYVSGSLILGIYNNTNFNIYMWNPTSKTPVLLNSWGLVNMTYAKAAYADGYIYFFPYQVNNLDNGTIYWLATKLPIMTVLGTTTPTSTTKSSATTSTYTIKNINPATTNKYNILNWLKTNAIAIIILVVGLAAAALIAFCCRKQETYELGSPWRFH